MRVTVVHYWFLGRTTWFQEEYVFPRESIFFLRNNYYLVNTHTLLHRPDIELTSFATTDSASTKTFEMVALYVNTAGTETFEMVVVYMSTNRYGYIKWYIKFMNFDEEKCWTQYLSRYVSTACTRKG